MDAFFAAIEQRDNPQWQGLPIVVGGQPNTRGVVATCSYEARKFGIHSAMASSKAYRLCPQAIFVAPRFSVYQQASKIIHQIFYQYTDLVEPLSLDEAYLDVSSLDLYGGSATLIAEEIRQDIFKATALTASAGVSYNKFLAKVASDMNKPDGQYVIRPEQGESFVATLPVGKFYGVGKVTEKKMHKHHIFSGADLKQKSRLELSRLFGSAADYYFNIARGEDHRPVSIHRQRKSLGAETTLSTDITDLKQIHSILEKLTDEVCGNLKKKKLYARVVQLKVKYFDFKQITRQASLNDFTQSHLIFDKQIKQLLHKTQAGERAIRLLGVSVSDLESNMLSSRPIQLSLFDNKVNEI